MLHIRENLYIRNNPVLDPHTTNREQSHSTGCAGENKRKENLFTDLIFHLNKFEFEFLKDKYLYITGKELKDFETIVKQNIDPAQQELADDFFNS